MAIIYIEVGYKIFLNFSYFFSKFENLYLYIYIYFFLFHKINNLLIQHLLKIYNMHWYLHPTHIVPACDRLVLREKSNREKRTEAD
jgi:hypothetical protein